jgi:hypothetical protein
MATTTVKSNTSLHDRIREYEAAGWLENTAASYYHQLLRKEDPLTDERVARELQRAAQLAKSRRSSLGNPIASSTSSTNTNKTIKMNNRQQAASSSITNPTGKKLILDLSELPVSDDEFRELFVEMCFFARLGFVQPPCCLHCAYHESMVGKLNGKQTSKNESCPRWIVWRKDATQLLQPDNLHGNILLLQCCNVRRILKGEEIEGRVWMHETKQVVEIKHGRKSH